MSRGFAGMEALIADLEQLRTRAMPEAARPAVRMAGLAAVAIAKASAPRDSGRLARSIHMGGAGDAFPDFSPGSDSNMYRDMGAEEQKKNQAAVAVGTTLFYGRWVEYGSKKNAARYFMGNAVRAVDGLFRDALEDEMDDLAREIGF